MQLIKGSASDLRTFGRVMDHFRAKGIRDDEVVSAIKSVPRHYVANALRFDSGDALGHGRSVNVWGDFKFNQLSEDNQYGDFIWENFLSFVGQRDTVDISATLSPAAVGSSTAAAQTVAFAGTLTTDRVIALKKPTHQAGLAVDAVPLIGTADSLSINFVNPTAGAITPTASESYVLTVLRATSLFHGAQSGGWKSYTGGSTPSTITNLTTDFPSAPASTSNALGTIRMSSGAVAHQNCVLQSVGSQFALPPGALVTRPVFGQLPKLYFEVRVRFNQSTVQSAFIGMATPGKQSLNSLFNSSDAWVDTATIGFRINGTSSTSAINAGYGTTTAWTTAASGSTPSTITNFTKLGFVFDASKQKCLKFYQDGTLLAELAVSDIVAANWPSYTALAPIFYIQAQGSGGAAVTLDADWIGVGQRVAGN